LQIVLPIKRFAKPFYKSANPETHRLPKKLGVIVMSINSVSKTAIGTAFMRAAHLIIDSKPLILDDKISLEILGKNAIEKIISLKEYYQESANLHLRSHVVLRSRFAEDRLEKSVERGICQYLILGAGLDTFAYRQPYWANKLKIIEVDFYKTQIAKIKRLKDNHINIPDNVFYAAINFEKESLYDGLIRNGIDFGEPAFISWLGVTMYLTKEAIDAVFKTVASFPKNSEIVFTYAIKRETKSPVEDRAAELGEQWKSHFTIEEIIDKLTDYKYSTVYFLCYDDAKLRYFNNRSDNLPIPEEKSIVSATV
jgi:methyltransferase (TIGR00027 family)